ncbi:MAG TPA: hypothetical protein VFO27_03000, partial [Bryobacteraceae bacterium]|nr:hypothetical protein [Bryobacteraceae bacterium]
MRFAAIDHPGEPRATLSKDVQILGETRAVLVVDRPSLPADVAKAIQQPIVEATEDLEPVSERGSIALRPASTCDQLINSSPEGSYRMDTAK